MKKQLQLLIGCALFISSASFAREYEFRSPLSVPRTPMRFPLDHVSDAWWLDDMSEEQSNLRHDLFDVIDNNNGMPEARRERAFEICAVYVAVNQDEDQSGGIYLQCRHSD